MNAHIRNCCTWQRLALTALLMFTGTSQAAGLLTPSDGRFPELEIRDHAVDVVIEDGYDWVGVRGRAALLDAVAELRGAGAPPLSSAGPGLSCTGPRS